MLQSSNGGLTAQNEQPNMPPKGSETALQVEKQQYIYIVLYDLQIPAFA